MTAQSHKSLNTSKGFTLIELLVTIAIIAIISVVAVALFGNIQANARDAKRKAEVEAMANALEVNKNAMTGYYTTLAKTQMGGGMWPGQSTTTGAAAVDPQGFPYCIVTATTGIAAGPTSVGTWAAPATCPSGAAISDTMTGFSNITSFAVCTRLENTGTTSVYCKGNSQ